MISDFRENLVRNVNRKFFRFNLIERYEPLRVWEKDGDRFYTYTLEGDDPDNPWRIHFPSVTTIIAKHTDKTWLKEWRERVGDKEANAITESAKFRGNAIHEMAQKYLMGEEYWRGQGTINITDFNRIVPILNENVTCILGIELPLFSHRLRTAGRADLVCQWAGVNSVVDFKTSRRDKIKEEITDYFIQASVYALMVQEIYHLTIPQICVIILQDHEQPKVFYENPLNWMEKVVEYFGDRNVEL